MLFIHSKEWESNEIKEWVMNGNWEKLILWLDGFDITPLQQQQMDNNNNIIPLLLKSSTTNHVLTPQNLYYIKLLILEQKFCAYFICLRLS